MHLDKNYQRNVLKRWKPVVEAGKEITDPQVALSTALVLENTQREFADRGMIRESYSTDPAGATVPAANSWGGMGAQPGNNLDPNGGGALGTSNDFGVNDSRIPTVVIPTLRRVYPELLAHDIMGVQPMNGPVGFAYAIRHQYGVNGRGEAGSTVNQGDEIGYNTIHTDFTGASGLTEEDNSGDYSADANAGALNPARSANDYWQAFAGANGTDGDSFNGQGATLEDSEWWKIGEDMPMAQFKIEKGIVDAKTRKLGAHWSRELGEDMMNMHGIDVDQEMVNVLSYEIAAEIDRQCISEQVKAALNGVAGNHYSTWSPVSADGRHQQERIGTLYTQVLQASQRIATNTRRSHANYAVADSNVCAFLERMGDYTVDTASVVADADSVGVTRVGTLRQGSIKLYRDTFGGDYATGTGYVLLGYKGNTPYDAGVVYCPYIPLQLMRENGETDFTPRMGVRTRYGMLNNLFGAANYYHFIRVEGLTETALVADGGRVFSY